MHLFFCTTLLKVSHSFIYLQLATVTICQSVMACTSTVKDEKPQIPEINWSANNSSAVWALLAEIEKNENYHVLYRKKDVAEVSLLIPFTLDCLMWLVNRIQVVKPKLWSMLRLPNLSYQNCLLLIPAQFVTMSRASLKGKDLLCVSDFCQ